MLAKVLSWVALVCNVLAVVFNIGLLFFAFGYRPKGSSVAFEIVGLVIIGVFLLSGPIVTIFALLFGAPLARRSSAPAVASAFD
jgi:hypothetical protein